MSLSRLRAPAVLVALAALAATLAGYRPTLDPPALHPREVGVGAARAQLILDTPRSVLTNVGPATRYDAELAGRLAPGYVTFLKTDGSAAALGRAVGLHGEAVSVSGPFTLLVNRVNFAPQLPELPETGHVNGAYRVVVDVDGRNPTVSLYAQAPSAHAAVALVNAARALLVNYVAAREAAAPAPAGDAVVLRPLGPTVGGGIGGDARWQLMAFVFALVLAGGGSLLYARRHRRGRALAEARAAQSLDRLDARPPRSDDWPHTTRLLPWALAGFMAMLFLVPFDAIRLPFHLPLESTLDRPALVALVLLWIASLALLSGAAKPSMRLTRVHVAVLAFTAVCCVSLALNVHALANVGEVTLVVKKLALLISFVVFFFVVASALRPREVPRYAALMVGLGVVVAVGAVVEYRLQYNPFYELWSKVLPVTAPSTLDARDTIGRLAVYGPTIQPLELAALLAMVVPFALVGAIDAPTTRRRLLYTVAVGLLLAGGFATSRKTSMVAPAGAALLLLAYRPRAVGRALLPLGLALVILVHFTSPGAIGNVMNQFAPGNFGGALTTSDRTARYDAVRPDVVTHLLLGRGYQSYDPHKYRILDNEYLGLLITVGLVGVLAYLAIFGAMMSAAHRTIRGPDPRRASLALAALASVGVIAIGSALFDVLSFPHVPYLLFFVAAMIVALRRPSPMIKGPSAPAPGGAWLEGRAGGGEQGPDDGVTDAREGSGEREVEQLVAG